MVTVSYTRPEPPALSSSSKASVSNNEHFSSRIDDAAFSLTSVAAVIFIGAIIGLVFALLVNVNEVDLQDQHRQLDRPPASGVVSGEYILPNVSVDSRGVITDVDTGNGLHSVTAGAGLSGGTIIQGSGTISVIPTGVTSGSSTSLTRVQVNNRGQITSATADTSVSSVTFGPYLSGPSSNITLNPSPVVANIPTTSTSVTIVEQGLTMAATSGISTQHGSLRNARNLPDSLDFPIQFVEPPVNGVDIRMSYCNQIVTSMAHDITYHRALLAPAWKALGTLRPRYAPSPESDSVLDDVHVTTVPVGRMHVLTRLITTGRLRVQQERVAGSRRFDVLIQIYDGIAHGPAILANFIRSRDDALVSVVFAVENSPKIFICHKLQEEGLIWTAAVEIFSAPENVTVLATLNIGTPSVYAGHVQGVTECVSLTPTVQTWGAPSEVSVMINITALGSSTGFLVIQGNEGQVVLIDFKNGGAQHNVKPTDGNSALHVDPRNVHVVIDKLNGASYVSFVQPHTGNIHMAMSTYPPSIWTIRGTVAPVGYNPCLSLMDERISLSYRKADGYVYTRSGNLQGFGEGGWSVGDPLKIGKGDSLGVVVNLGIDGRLEQEIVYLEPTAGIFGGSGQLGLVWEAVGLI
jgi:hypothetical protein